MSNRVKLVFVGLIVKWSYIADVLGIVLFVKATQTIITSYGIEHQVRKIVIIDHKFVRNSHSLDCLHNLTHH